MTFMCRLLGIAANEPTEFRIVLREAPRSLAALSKDHPDGWGIAVFDTNLQKWQIDKGIRCAGEDERFHSLAVGSRAIERPDEPAASASKHHHRPRRRFRGLGAG